MEEQFDKTYRVELTYTDNPASRKKQQFVEQEQIRKQSELPNRPANIAFFEKAVYEKREAAGTRPAVGYFCNMVPEEIILAMGAEPVRLDCGNSALALVGEEIFAGEICPVAKASFGMFLREDSLASGCRALVIPTSCDAKKKMGEVLNDFAPAFMLNIPPEQNHMMYVKQTSRELKRLVEFLSKHLKTKLSAKALRNAIALTNERTAIIRELQEQRARNPQNMSICDFFLIIQASLFRRVALEEWIGEAQKTLEEMKGREPPRRSLRPRLVLTGAPMVWPNFKVLNLLEESGADVVADTLCTGAQSCFDPVVTDEKSRQSLLRALASRYVFAAICPCFVSQTTRINRILELREQHGAAGVVNYSLRLCQLFDIEQYRVAQTLKARKIPNMNVRTDYSLEDTEQLRVRIEAFLETL